MKKFRNRIVAFVAGVLVGPAVVWAGLETGTYISDLVVTNPLGSDLASTLDDHLRLLKSTIKATFPNINGAVSATDEELSLLAGKTGTVWTSANDGTGSGLDADTVDGAAPVTVANPTGTIGLAAVNGSAATAMRSDGAPALSQAIAPTMTAAWIFSQAFAGSGTFGTPAVAISSAIPMLVIDESDGASDNKSWQHLANSEQYLFRTATDNAGSAANIFTVDRTGTTVDRVAFPTDGGSKSFVIGTPQAVTFGNHRTEISTNSTNTALAVSNTGTATTMAVNNSGAGDQTYITFFTGASTRGSISYNSGGGVVAYNTTSDERLKNNFKPSPSARTVIDCVRVESYDWKETGKHVTHGLVAQRLNKCAPYAVTQGDIWQIDPSKLVPAMIKYMQEQDARIAQLERNARRH